jgi:hypothetical protein
MGFIDDAVETKECFDRTIGQLEKPFEIAWALIVKCEADAALGQNEVLLESAEKIIDISERYGYRARRGNGLFFRGLARSQLANLMRASMMSAREWLFGAVRAAYFTPQSARACCVIFLCGRIASTRRLKYWMMSMPSLAVPTKSAFWLSASGFVAKSPQVRVIRPVPCFYLRRRLRSLSNRRPDYSSCVRQHG